MVQERALRDGEVLELSQGMIVPPGDTNDRTAPAPQPKPSPPEIMASSSATADGIPHHAVQSPTFSAQAFGALREAVRNRKPTLATHRGGPTIEEILREEMRPLLREWLDLHLGAIVERAVRQEIDRLSRQEEI